MSELPELVQAMLDPGIYPDAVTGVEMMQTQMSFVFLTHSAGSGQAGKYVYKVKKPVDLGYLDYTTLQKRQFYCQREVELNRRLCPEVYLGVIPINHDKNTFSLDGKGKTVEYAVKMLNLPQERMLNVLLPKKQVTAEMISGVAARMADFHSRAATNATISDYGDIESIITNTEENFIQTVRYIGKTLSQSSYRHIKEFTNGFIEKKVSLFYERISDGRIRDCHGDLHAAHICFGDDIYIYDCIEFNDRFRYCDTASEIAFLAMDLDRYDRPDLSKSFVDAYVKSSGDKDLLKMLDFYKCYRAYVRGKVSSFMLDDSNIPENEKSEAQAAATRYFELAESYI
jgi:aminoglycoside phosphotransferase family enzyme